MNISLKVDLKGEKQFTKAMEEQFPFATAVALTLTAKQAEEKVKAELPSHFILRNQFTKNSIKTKPAEKREWPHSYAVVGSISPYLIDQEEGGTKTPASKAFAIPKRIRNDVSKLVPRSRWPGRILLEDVKIPGGGRTQGSKNGSRKNPVPFLLREKDGIGVYVRVSKRGRGLKRLFRLTRQTVHIKGRHWLVVPVTEIVEKNFSSNFDRALTEALRTAR